MEINFDSAAAVPIINVPAKKVSPQGTSLTREMNGLPIIRYSMVYTHTSWSLRKSSLPQNALQAIFPMMALSRAIWPLVMIHTKI